MYYEEFSPGDKFLSRGRTVTETEGVQFVNMAWYLNPRCTDAEFVRKGYIWNGVELHHRIVPPPMGTFLAGGLARSIGILNDTQMAVLATTWRAPGVIAFGDTIHLEMQVTDKRDAEREDAGIVVFDMRVFNQKGELVNNDQQVSLVARRPEFGGPADAAPYFFATIDDQKGHFECPQAPSSPRRQAQMTSQYFEDFVVGDAFDTRSRTVTEADVCGLIALSWDHHPLYTDAEYARRTRFKGRIAPPLLGIGYAVGLDAPLAMAAGTCLGFTHTDWRFVGPIRVGDTIQLRQTIGSKTETDERTGIVTLDMDIVNERGGISISGTRYMVVLRKPAEEAAKQKLMAWH
jgi:acyl dehydratase